MVNYCSREAELEQLQKDVAELKALHTTVTVHSLSNEDTIASLKAKIATLKRQNEGLIQSTYGSASDFNELRVQILRKQITTLEKERDEQKSKLSAVRALLVAEDLRIFSGKVLILPEVRNAYAQAAGMIEEALK